MDEDLSPPYDIVFASYSLNVHEIRDAIRKLEEASSCYMYLYWFAGEPSWDAMSREFCHLLVVLDCAPHSLPTKGHPCRRCGQAYDGGRW
ncbi:hypothetical protein [Methanogenium organophilum]|uniref:Uncharacterized protein n=1 Tax=Methanogenium organophilum TaxID=2199 RepID=A0A9X9S5E8_METOG|nr:hypothetical protein [Methanogenium organophilum]WAI01996.1 hypothetical protein OU421_03755 [Methanogenium organophilum]